MAKIAGLLNQVLEHLFDKAIDTFGSVFDGAASLI
jgi:hypothetical protein